MMTTTTTKQDDAAATFGATERLSLSLSSQVSPSFFSRVFLSFLVLAFRAKTLTGSDITQPMRAKQHDCHHWKLLCVCVC